MRVLVACEYSGRVREAFREKGHDVYSCDLEPSEDNSPFHYQGDVFDIIDGWAPVHFAVECDPDGDGWCQLADCDPGECNCLGPTQDGIEYKEVNGVLLGRPEDHPRWDFMLAFPPCTHLAVSGAKHFEQKRKDGRQQQGIDFFMSLANADIEKIVIENPIGIMSKLWRKPDQIIQPWMFGDPFQKSTCLWLKNVTKLIDEPSDSLFGKRQHVDKGEFVTTPSGKRLPKWYSDNTSAKNRSRTFPGIARAMAEQWG